MDLLTLFMNGVNCKLAGFADDPVRVLTKAKYGLKPAFIDGMLDAVPPTMTLVDGLEDAYRFNSEREFLAGHNWITSANGPAIRFVSAENRYKYRAQVQAGFGIFLDMYTVDESNGWYMDKKGDTSVKRLQKNVMAALAAADQYVWVYGQNHKWWSNPFMDNWMEEQFGNAVQWQEALPGITEALNAARDPDDVAKQIVASEENDEKLVNLAVNPGFELSKVTASLDGCIDWRGDSVPAGYFSWQQKGSNGTFSWDQQFGCRSNKSAKAVNVKEGCLLQKLQVESGDIYWVELESLLKGNGRACVTIGWQDAEGEWIRGGLPTGILYYNEQPDSPWQKASGSLVIKQGVTFMIVMMRVYDQEKSDDICWFDNLNIYKLGQ